MSTNINPTDLDIKLMEERLKIARMQNAGLVQQLNNLDAANARLERLINENEHRIFWEDINRDIYITIPTTTCNIQQLSSSQMDIVTSAYGNCSFTTLDHFGFINLEYFNVFNQTM